MPKRQFSIQRLCLVEPHPDVLHSITSSKFFVKWNSLTASGTTYPAKLLGENVSWAQTFEFTFDATNPIQKIVFSVCEMFRRGGGSSGGGVGNEQLSSPMSSPCACVGEASIFTSDIRTIHAQTSTLYIPISLTLREIPHRAVLHVNVTTDAATCGDVILARRGDEESGPIQTSISALYFPTFSTVNAVYVKNTQETNSYHVEVRSEEGASDILVPSLDRFTLKPKTGKLVLVSIAPEHRHPLAVDVASKLRLLILSRDVAANESTAATTTSLEALLDHPSIAHQHLGRYHYIIGTTCCCRNTSFMGETACRISPGIIQGLVPTKAFGYSIRARCVTMNWKIISGVTLPSATVEEGGVCVVHGTTFAVARDEDSVSEDSGQVVLELMEVACGEPITTAVVAAVGILHLPLCGAMRNSVVVYLNFTEQYRYLDEITQAHAKLHCTLTF
eukprot:PhF_6_TR2198/c0_g1_i1/m.3646